MSREIKFRIWNGIEKRWVLNTDWVFLSHFDYIYPLAKISHFIQQFTGLHDKNGKEIYEGDILENTEYESRFKIEWAGETDYCGFVTVNVNNGLRDLFLNKNFTKCQIIGNIFENPDLLGQ